MEFSLSLPPPLSPRTHPPSKTKPAKSQVTIFIVVYYLCKPGHCFPVNAEVTACKLSDDLHIPRNSTLTEHLKIIHGLTADHFVVGFLSAQEGGRYVKIFDIFDHSLNKMRSETAATV